MIRARCFLLLLASCTTSSSSNDVHGPFTGATHRYVVDGFDLPYTSTRARELADDLDGDGLPDNRLSSLLFYFYNNNDLQIHEKDMFASGALDSSVDIIADDLQSDDSVGVSYIGGTGDPFTIAGGRFEDGWFRSNRTAETSLPGRAVIRLPVMEDADAASLDVSNLEINLVPDGAGGYEATLRGTIDSHEAILEAYRLSQQMVAANPTNHLDYVRLFDLAPHDWVLTEQEFTTNSLLVSLLSPDVTLHGEMLLSIGFGVHLSPCSDGRCTSAPAEPCFDRVRDGDETDVDCGGSCGACPTAATCSVDDDCDSHACNGTCAAPSCTDGVRDGFETDVDCGSNCGACTIGQRCHKGSDCMIGQSCGPPCTDPNGCVAPYFATCQ